MRDGRAIEGGAEAKGEASPCARSAIFYGDMVPFSLQNCVIVTDRQEKEQLARYANPGLDQQIYLYSLRKALFSLAQDPRARCLQNQLIFMSYSWPNRFFKSLAGRERVGHFFSQDILLRLCVFQLVQDLKSAGCDVWLDVEQYRLGTNFPGWLVMTMLRSSVVLLADTEAYREKIEVSGERDECGSLKRAYVDRNVLYFEYCLMQHAAILKRDGLDCSPFPFRIEKIIRLAMQCVGGVEISGELGIFFDSEILFSEANAYAESIFKLLEKIGLPEEVAYYYQAIFFRELADNLALDEADKVNLLGKAIHVASERRRIDSKIQFSPKFELSISSPDDIIKYIKSCIDMPNSRSLASAVPLELDAFERISRYLSSRKILTIYSEVPKDSASLCLAYAATHQADFDDVFVLEAGGVDITRYSYCRMARRLGFSYSIDEYSLEYIARSVQLLLSEEQEKKYLLLLLGAVAYKSVRHYLPNLLSTRHQVLMTTTHADAGWPSPFISLTEIDFVEDDSDRESYEVVQASFGRKIIFGVNPLADLDPSIDTFYSCNNKEADVGGRFKIYQLAGEQQERHKLCLRYLRRLYFSKSTCEKRFFRVFVVFQYIDISSEYYALLIQFVRAMAIDLSSIGIILETCPLSLALTPENQTDVANRMIAADGFLILNTPGFKDELLRSEDSRLSVSERPWSNFCMNVIRGVYRIQVAIYSETREFTRKQMIVINLFQEKDSSYLGFGAHMLSSMISDLPTHHQVFFDIFKSFWLDNPAEEDYILALRRFHEGCPCSEDLAPLDSFPPVLPVVEKYFKKTIAPEHIFKLLDKAYERAVTPDGLSKYQIPMVNMYYVAREADEKLLELFSAGDCIRVVLKGMGGMGKTQLASRLVQGVIDRYSCVVWLHAESEEHLKMQLIELGNRLNLPSPSGIKVDTVLTWFRTQAETLLLVLDDVQNDYLLEQYFSEVSTNILITTRDSASWSEPKYQVIEVDKLAPDKALLLLENILGGIDDDLDAKSGLVTRLGCMPLALLQAASYIKQQAQKGRHFAIKDFELRYDAMIDFLSSRPVECLGEHESIWISFNINLREVESTNPVAIEVLQCCCFLMPDVPIPVDLLRKIIPEDLSDFHVVWRKVKDVLIKYSFLQINEGGDFFKIHTVLQEVLRHKYQVSVDAMFQRTIHAVISYFDPIRYARQKVTANEYILWQPHIMHIVAKNVEQLKTKLGVCFIALIEDMQRIIWGDLEFSNKYLELPLTWIDDLQVDSCYDRGIYAELAYGYLYLNLMTYYNDQNKPIGKVRNYYMLAEREFKELPDTCWKQQFQETLYTNMAGIQFTRGDFDAAITSYQAAKDKLERAGERNRNLAMCYLMLARSLFYQSYSIDSCISAPRLSRDIYDEIYENNQRCLDVLTELGIPRKNDKSFLQVFMLFARLNIMFGEVGKARSDVDELKEILRSAGSEEKIKCSAEIAAVDFCQGLLAFALSEYVASARFFSSATEKFSGGNSVRRGTEAEAATHYFQALTYINTGRHELANKYFMKARECYVRLYRNRDNINVRAITRKLEAEPEPVESAAEESAVSAGSGC